MASLTCHHHCQRCVYRSLPDRVSYRPSSNTRHDSRPSLRKRPPTYHAPRQAGGSPPASPPPRHPILCPRRARRAPGRIVLAMLPCLSGRGTSNNSTAVGRDHRSILSRKEKKRSRSNSTTHSKPTRSPASALALLQQVRRRLNADRPGADHLARACTTLPNLNRRGTPPTS